jgi:hypothetical protein
MLIILKFQVSKRWERIINSDQLWEDRCRNKYVTDDHTIQQVNWKTLYFDKKLLLTKVNSSFP